uniref:CUB domain-containing protein n=1 Tax=Strigamia maritima TaxID=126957 RepID=T1IVJ3_STRMM
MSRPMTASTRKANALQPQTPTDSSEAKEEKDKRCPNFVTMTVWQRVFAKWSNVEQLAFLVLTLWPWLSLFWRWNTTIMLVIAADQTSVSGDPISLSHDSTLHPPLPFPTTTKAPKCDRMFISNPNGPRNGTFNAPDFKNPTNHSRQCIYTFIAATNERCYTKYTARALYSRCNHEYLDLYTEIDDPHSDLITTPFGGRYCGRIPPRKRISMYHVLIIGFYTDKPTVDDFVFTGMYEFIDASRFQIGTPTPHMACGFTIRSDQKKEGNFCSPTYPGNKNQRVRLEFMDFDLFYGGPHCPFDYIKVFDGPDSSGPVIGRYCIQQRNLVIYSSTENLYVQFNTLNRIADSQNRGFSANFEFSERYVNLGFIQNNDGEHMRGSECDQTILSKKESNGTVYSPNYPFLYHPNTICRYFIYGLQDQQNLERVRLEFDKFEIPDTDPTCADSYLKLYLRGQEENQEFDKHDHSLCGRVLPPATVSDGPRLFMVFNSGKTQGQGFKAKYVFETEYLVPGTPAPDGSCNFTYFSESHLSGEFNSPRHPSNYPSNLSCIYTMEARPGEQIKLTFEQVSIKTLSTVQYGNSCQNDWIEIDNILSDGRPMVIGRYCGTKTPGPIVTNFGSQILRVSFHTDETNVGNGFRARYIFQSEESIFGDCGKNISDLEDGILSSPGYPETTATSGRYCNWYIYVKPHHRVLLVFTDFALQEAAEDVGCPTSVIRIWKSLDANPLEICGNRFVTAEKTTVSFRAVWTEIREGPHCDRFRCAINGYCISQQLQCNRIPNCGLNDTSDEDTCEIQQNDVQSTIDAEEISELDLYLLTGVIVGVSLLILMSICIWCHRKHKRRRDELHPHEVHHRHVCDAAGARFSSVDSV